MVKRGNGIYAPPREFNLNIRISLSVILLPRPYTYLDIKGYHLQGQVRLLGICLMWEGDSKFQVIGHYYPKNIDTFFFKFWSIKEAGGGASLCAPLPDTPGQIL